MIQLSTLEAGRVAGRILPELDHFAQLYNEEKYPPLTYSELRKAFQHPDTVTPGDVRKALLWKFGHMNKSNIPAAHERLISEIQYRLPPVAGQLSTSAQRAFALMDEAFGGPTRFITVAFLTHLVHPQTAPIIDQHNFRAVNHLIGQVRDHEWPRKKPSSYEDISLLADFMHAVLKAWERTNGDRAPDQITFDRYLMMFGKALKARNLD